jgi:hypothetical protein
MKPLVIVRLPVLLKVTAFWMVPPPFSAIFAPVAAVVSTCTVSPPVTVTVPPRTAARSRVAAPRFADSIVALTLVDRARVNPPVTAPSEMIPAPVLIVVFPVSVTGVVLKSMPAFVD